MALDLGYDESGSGDILLVSVQIAIGEQAKKLKRQWRNVLREAGVEYFHSKEFNNFDHGVFAGLDRDERDELLKKLSTLIHRHLSAGVTGKVTKSLYDTRTTQEFRSRWGTAYTFAVNILLIGAYSAAKSLGLALNPEFNILVEGGHRHTDQAIETLHDAKKKGLSIPAKIISVRIGSKEDHPLLQAADMLAYSVWQRSRGEDSRIFNALNARPSLYTMQYVNLDTDLIDIVKEGVAKWTAHKKAFGERRSAPSV